MEAGILIIESDREILEEYSAGESSRAATALVRKYQKFVYATAYRFLKTHDDADDAAQEAFIKAITSLNKFRGDSSLKTWLYRITVNVCKNYLRKKKLTSMFRGYDDQPDAYIDIPDAAPDPLGEVERNEFRQEFFKALAKLPDKQRETFALKYFEEMKYEEISDMLGTSVGGLKANYYQAVRKLANYLKDKVD
jgi:RNA polymerase sigma-70 factor (ECF subfamily)